MAGPPNSGMQVERVLEDLIARLSRAEPSKEVRAALIEARRLRSVTLTWTAIPPPPDARREMLSKVMGLVARVGVGAAPRPSAEVRAEFASLPPPEPGRPRAPTPPEPTRQRAPTPAPSSLPAASWRESDRRQSSIPPSGADPGAYSLPPLAAERLPRFDEGDGPVSKRPSPRPSPPETREAREAREVSREPDEGGGESSTDSRARRTAPVGARKPSPAPFRRAPSAQSFTPPQAHSITAIGNQPREGHAPPERTKRTFGSGGSTQTNLTRPLKSMVGTGIHLVRPQATAWQAYPRVPGAKLKLLWRDADSGDYTALLHLAPGTTLPSRRHAAVEEMLLVEGSATVGTWEMRPGEYCRAEAGSVHEPIKTEEGCTYFVTGSEHDEIVEEGQP